MKELFREDAPIVARLHEYFSEQAAVSLRPSNGPASVVPPPKHMAQILTAAFWASLEREEGYPTKISLAYADAPLDDGSLVFTTPVSLSPRSLAKVAPAVERAGVHLVVAPGDDGPLRVLGASLHLPARTFVVEVTRAGELVVKHPQAGPLSKFVNVAVISGDVPKLVVESDTSRLDCRALLANLLEEALASPEAHRSQPAGVLVDLALSMRAHGRGGTLLVVPQNDSRWRESIRTPIVYEAQAPFEELRRQAESLASRSNGRRRAKYLRAVEAVAGFTAVDGATVMTETLHVLTFGAKIVRRDGAPHVEKVIVSEPVEGNEPVVEDPSALGGTRHLSAVQFVYDQRDALALVASQDGRFTVFAWSPCDDAVHARRIDVLVL